MRSANEPLEGRLTATTCLRGRPLRRIKSDAIERIADIMRTDYLVPFHNLSLRETNCDYVNRAIRHGATAGSYQ
jgi:hypothetical protein